MKSNEEYSYKLFDRILAGDSMQNELRLVVDEEHKILYCELPKGKRLSLIKFNPPAPEERH